MLLGYRLLSAHAAYLGGWRLFEIGQPSVHRPRAVRAETMHRRHVLPNIVCWAGKWRRNKEIGGYEEAQQPQQGRAGGGVVQVCARPPPGLVYFT